ncbi:MAG: glycoside hydrolase family 2 [Bacteroidales bacterium]|nr:glycoside hydrolase family 2 [Bacteroidales bacterium]
MKRIILVLSTVFCILSLGAQNTEVLYLSGCDKDNTVEWDFFCTHGMNSGKWSKIAVPSCWELQGFGSYLYGNVNKNADEKGLYKYEFKVPSGWKSKQVCIVFEGSMTDTEVKINGKAAGPVHQGAFYRFRYDISGLLDYEGINLLEVAVSKESANESVNRAERVSDYWVFGGIFRPVYLEAFPVQHIDRVAIDAKADGSFYMDVFTEGSGKAKTVSAQIETVEGKPVGEPLSVKYDPAGKMTFRGNFPGVAKWDPEFPNMHRVVVSLKKGKKTLHQITQKFGFRTVEVREEDGIYVNGTKIIFKGVCRHTFWPSSGRTSSKELAVNDVLLMKEMNMNAVRMSHYPPDQYFLDVCDSLGLFVLDELAGWQAFYDTPTAKRLVKQLVERDVNHPSIVLWDNGNEGGFNKEVRGDFALYDPQKRTVIEPWAIVNGTNTKHYPRFEYVKNALNNGKEIFFPTEFLHGLYDGGHGAGLDDQWDFMMSKPLSAGAFLWVFADEGVERRDLNDSIDANGNRGPDGILGPYHEKEGSFYTVKDIWSPLQFSLKSISHDFDGRMEVTNGYLYTPLNQCSYTFDLVKYENAFPDLKEVTVSSGKISFPEVAPGKTASLKLDLPSGWRDYDVLYLRAYDRHGMIINTWSWNISSASALAERTVKPEEGRLSMMERGDLVAISSGGSEISFSRTTGLIVSVRKNGNIVPFSGGAKFTVLKAVLKAVLKTGDPEFKHYTEGRSYVVEVLYSEGARAKWTFDGSDWIKLDYEYSASGEFDYAGITFSFPEESVRGARLMANGPYHVWKNRLRGVNFGVHDKKYNNTITGESWDYPEFKGYYSNFYCVRLDAGSTPVTVVAATPGLYLHLFTPANAKFSGRNRGVRGEVTPPFPEGDISFLHGISAIGTKFSTAAAEGPQGEKNRYNGEKLGGTLYFRFGE